MVVVETGWGRKERTSVVPYVSDDEDGPGVTLYGEVRRQCIVVLLLVWGLGPLAGERRVVRRRRSLLGRPFFHLRILRHYPTGCLLPGDVLSPRVCANCTVE